MTNYQRGMQIYFDLSNLGRTSTEAAEILGEALDEAERRGAEAFKTKALNVLTLTSADVVPVKPAREK